MIIWLQCGHPSSTKVDRCRVCPVRAEVMTVSVAGYAERDVARSMWIGDEALANELGDPYYYEHGDFDTADTRVGYERGDALSGESWSARQRLGILDKLGRIPWWLSSLGKAAFHL